MILLFVRIRQSSNQVDRSLPLKTKLGNLDFLGTVLFLGAICCLLLVLQWGGQTYPWSDSKCIGLFVGFGLLTVLFCVWQWYRGDRAIIPFRILRKRSIWMGALVLCFLGMSSLVVSAPCQMYPKCPKQRLCFNTSLVCVLSPNLLPVSSRCIHYPEWSSIHRARPAPDSRSCHSWRHCLPMGILCKLSRGPPEGSVS